VRTLQFITAPVEIQAAAAGKAAPRFTATAYTGIPMRLTGFGAPVVVDLKGIKPRGSQLPVLRNHDDNRLVGHTVELAITEQGVSVAGVISGAGADASEVIQAAKNGFAWQISIGAQPTAALQSIAKGQSVTVNGRTFVGPILIARAATLSEISFVPSGADANTSAAIAAKERGMETEVTETPSVDTAIKAERERRKRIDTTAEVMRGRIPEESLTSLTIRAASGELSFEQFQEKCIAAMQDHEELTAERNSRGRPFVNRSEGPAIHCRNGLPTSGITAIEAALVVKAGHLKVAQENYGERVLDSLGGLERASVPDILGMALRTAGEHVPHGRDEMIRAAISNHSVQVALSNVSNLSLIAGYKNADSPIDDVCAIRSADNFKEHTSVRPTTGLELETVPNSGEVKHSTFAEDTFPWAVDQYATMLTVGRKDLINDSLRLWDEVAPMMGAAARRKENDLFVKTLMSATSAYFDGSLGNLVTTPFDVTALGAAIARMRTQREVDEDLDLAPTTLYVPPALEVAATAALESQYIQRLATDEGPTGNALKGKLKLKVDSRLSNSARFGAGATATQWFLFSAPQNAPMIFAYLQGRRMPIVEFFGLDKDPRFLACSWRVYHDFGCALGDYRAAQRSTGAGS
jgi:phage head maturation protease